MPHVLWESFRAVFCYAALELGAFEKYGLEVTFGTVPSGVDTGQALRDGQVHVVWGGPMRVMVDRDRLPDSDLTCFCEFVARDPFFLIGRTPRPHFALRDLTEVHLATVSEAPTPWMCLRDDLVRAGVDPDGLSRIADRSMQHLQSRPQAYGRPA